MRVAVLMGGPGGEAEVSRDSAANVQQALGEAGHEAVLLEANAQLPERLANGFDAVFIAVHGLWGEDGALQGLCEVLGLPYTGSGVLATALAYDKATTKQVLTAAGLSTPRWRLLGGRSGAHRSPDELAAVAREVGLPVVVKPRRGGSTLGLTIVPDAGGLAAAVDLAALSGDVLVERCVAGVEVTVGVVEGADGPEPLPTLEIVSHRPVYDYAAKYTAGGSEHIIPARLPEPQRLDAQRTAVAAHTALGCAGMSRVDIIVDAAGRPWILEVNSIPGLTELSLLPDAARAAGISFVALCQGVLDHALSRHHHGVGA